LSQLPELLFRHAREKQPAPLGGSWDISCDHWAKKKLIRRTLDYRLCSSMNSAFAGKVVLITGGISGIGRATAVAFAEKDPNVVNGWRETAGAESVRLADQAGDNCAGSGL
jgi:hypothetical protein